MTKKTRTRTLDVGARHPGAHQTDPAVTAFGAFTVTSGALMFAWIICPDQKMWTISVWLYQF